MSVRVYKTETPVRVTQQVKNIIRVAGLGPRGPRGEAGADGADGQDGRDVEFQNSGTHIQWRFVGDVSWTNLIALTEITGPAGAQGSQGPAGATGAAGDPGAAATITLGSVATGSAGSSVIITNSGTSNAAVFNFTIPRGDVGATGATGATGSTGAAGADGDDGREVEIQNNGTHIQWRYVGDVSWTNIVALSAITGPAGATGATGSQGPQGDPGVGVPIGGNTSQVLRKASATDYDTEWADADTGLTQAQVLARGLRA